MPVCTLFLLSINVPLHDFLSILSKSAASPLVTAKVVHWIVRPTSLSVSPLLTQEPQWDVLLVFPNADALPNDLKSTVAAEWTVTAEIASDFVTDYDVKSKRLRHPRPGGSHAVDVTEELRDWMQAFGRNEGKCAVTMFNLLAYAEGKKETYMKYVQGLGEPTMAPFGIALKMFGPVVECSSTARGRREWDDLALVHYPSILHFGDMLSSQKYKDLDLKYKVGTFRDTCVLCVSEVDLPTEAAVKG